MFEKLFKKFFGLMKPVLCRRLLLEEICFGRILIFLKESERMGLL